MKTFEEFEAACDDTWRGFPPMADPLLFLSTAIAGETGELCEHVKKLYRDDAIGDWDRRELLIKKEIGDIMYYLSRAARQLGTTLDEIARLNAEKLADRKMRGVTRGEGDER
jgi:NTP pyrophosphatase (non-canonical NTP hydrolase)